MDMALFAVGATATVGVLVPTMIFYVIAHLISLARWRYQEYVRIKYSRERQWLSIPPYDELIVVRGYSSDDCVVYFMKNGKRVYRDETKIRKHL